MKKSSVELLAVAAIVAVAQIVPLPAGLTRPGLSSVVLLLCAIYLWVSKTMPAAVTALLFTTLMPFFNILSLSEVFVRIGNSTFYFMIATYCLTMAISSSTIPERVSAYLLRAAGTSSAKLLIYFSFGAAAFSSIMSNIPACAIFCALILSLVRESAEMRENKGLVKTLLIGVTYGALIGGFATPAGTSANIFSMNLFGELTGKEVSFLDWTCVGIPVVIVSMVIACICLLLVFRPQPIGQETLEAARKMQGESRPLTSREWKILLITAGMLVCWVLGSWVPVLNSTAVALLGMCLFFFPGIEVLEWKQVATEMSWNTIFLVGGSGALARGISVTGADVWMVETVLPDVSGMNPFVLLIICAVITAILHVLIPSGSATIAIALPLFLQLTQASGMSDLTVMMLCTLWGAVVLVSPIDAVTMVSYSSGHYEIKDLLKGGLVTYLITVPVSVLLIRFLCGIVF